MRERRRWVRVLAALVAFGPAAAGASAAPGTPTSYPESGSGPSRETEPVILAGAALPELLGFELSRLGPYRFDAESGEYEPTPFQLDERFDRVFNQGTDVEFTENIYDVFGQDDGRLDADDELVFLFRDAGPEAAPGAAWPQGAGNLRYEIRITDPAAEPPLEPRWVYLFSGVDPAPQGESVRWDGQYSTGIETDVFSLDFVDRWLLVGYRVFPPCGGGMDLIDRVKARAGLRVDHGESEQTWNGTSFYMGGLVGPVRAIRYVRGAASGLNTIHHDIVYPDLWERVVNLRVHPVNHVWFYIDWLPQLDLVYFAPDVPDGLPMDGVPDSGVGTETVPWQLVRGRDGGLVLMSEIPPSPYLGDTATYYRDDENFDDAPAYPPYYPDDDDSAFGNHGYELIALGGSETDVIPIRVRAYPLCASVGDASMGSAYRRLWDEPLETRATPDWRLSGPIRSLAVRLADDEVILEWQAQPGADAYRVYYSTLPFLPHEQWALLEETPATSVTDPAPVAPVRFYSVIAVLDGEEGPW